MTSPTRCCRARSASSCRASSESEKPLRVPCTDRDQRLAVDLGELERLHRMRVAEREGVVGADDDLAGPISVDQELYGARLEHQLVVVEALRGDRGRFAERLLRLRKHV